MMRELKTLVFFAVLAVFITGCATTGATAGSTSGNLQRIQEQGELVVGVSGNMPPMNMTDKSGKLIGLDVDLARVMAGAMGVSLRLEPMAFADLLPALEAGNVDVIVSNMTMTPERNLRAAFVGPYFNSGKCVLSKIETLAKAQEVETINQTDVRLTALQGSTSQVFIEELAPKAQFTSARDYDEAVNLVLTDKVHAMIADYPICVVSVLRHKDAGLISVITTLIYEPIGVALPAGDAQFINWTENFLHRMEKTNQLQLLRRRWFERDDWLTRLP